MKSQVMISRADFDTVGKEITRAFEQFPVDPDPQKIVIKPNFCTLRTPETGTVTHPRVLEELLRYLRSIYPGSQLVIAESDATGRYIEPLFTSLGIRRLASKYRARCVNLSTDELVDLRQGSPKITIGTRIPAVLQDADLLISVPKLKTHTTIKMTCALKNQFGCLPKKNKIVYHKMLDRTIAECNLLFKPDLVLVDGIISMGGAGPIVGFPIRSRMIVAGSDPVAVDSACAQILGMHPRFVGHIAESAAMGVGSMDFEALGLQPKEVKIPVQFKGLWHSLVRLVEKYEQA